MALATTGEGKPLGAKARGAKARGAKAAVKAGTKPTGAKPIGAKSAGKPPARWRLSPAEAQLLRSLPIGLYRAGANGRLEGPRHLNPELAVATGFPAIGFVANPDLWTSRIHVDDLPRVQACFAAVKPGEEFVVEYRWLGADDTERVFRDRGTLVTEGGCREIRGTILDITREVRLSRRLLWAHRLEMVGDHIDNLAHDMMNMLSVTIWNLDGIMRAVENGTSTMGERDRERVRTASTGATSAVDMFKKITAVARQPQRRARKVELAELLADIEPMLALAAGDKVEVVTEIAGTVGPVPLEQALFEAGLLALAQELREAMPHGGKLSVQADRRALAADGPELTGTGLAAGPYVTLHLSADPTKPGPDDHGRFELPPSVAERLVDLANDKAVRLALVRNQAALTGGHVAVESPTAIAWYLKA